MVYWNLFLCNILVTRLFSHTCKKHIIYCYLFRLYVCTFVRLHVCTFVRLHVCTFVRLYFTHKHSRLYFYVRWSSTKRHGANFSRTFFTVPFHFLTGFVKNIFIFIVTLTLMTFYFQMIIIIINK